jgi:hypothetical protein
MEQRMAPYPQHGQLQPNPEGMAAFGAIVGVMVGGVAGSLLALAFRPATEITTLADSPEEAMNMADVEAQALIAKWKTWRRVSHVLGGVLATGGAALGAHLGASPRQKRTAMYGAMIGTGSMRLLNIAFNPPFGLPGLIAGGVGAYIGARRAG